jgi:hypothetical protein
MFDPNFHEALMTRAGAKDLILEEMEKGYRIQDRVLRRAKVIVGNGEEKQTEPPATDAQSVTANTTEAQATDDPYEA